jgi:hypothetical protein
MGYSENAGMVRVDRFKKNPGNGTIQLQLICQNIIMNH